MNNYEFSKFDYETKLVDNRKKQITNIYESELLFANVSTNKENLTIAIVKIGKIIYEFEKWLDDEIKLKNLDEYTLKQCKTRLDYLKYENDYLESKGE